MKLNYKVLWIEDYPKDMQVQIRKIKQLISSNYLVPEGLEITDAFKSYDEFMRFIEKRDKDDFSNIDLILVDYNLSDPKKCTGINIVKMLRDKKIYTDVMFYSGNISEALKQVKVIDGELDNVTYTDNSMNFFIPKFENVLSKQLALIMQISDLRGYLMDSTSDFDFTMRCFVQRYFPLLATEDQQVVCDEIEKCINKQEVNECNKFNKTKNTHDDTYVKKAMDSQEYVMTVKNKIYIMALIMQKHSGRSEDFATNFANQYDEEIIKYRNKLAHKKLIYGTNQSGHIKIADTLEDLTCDCDDCKAKLTRNDCENLRKHIYNYYSFFNGLLQK